MSEQPIQLDTLVVRVREIPLRKIRGGPDRMFVQTDGTGKVLVDFADGVNVWGKALELNEAQYEAIRQEAFQMELAGLEDIPTYTELYSSSRNSGATTTPNGNTLGRVNGETPASGKAANDANAEVENETPAEGIAGDEILDGVQLGLDIVGLIPVVGEIADIANAGISLARGDYAGAALSLVSAIPFAGYVGTAGKIVQHATKTTAEASAKASKEVAKAPSKATKATAEGGGKVLQKKLEPGTLEHKADRWQKYQGRGGKKDYNRWSKQYDTNMRNYKYGAAREAAYRNAMGATEGTLKTPLTMRQIDILKKEEMYAGQLKTGPVSLTKDNLLAIAKDAELVKRTWTVEHILEKGASKPYLEALEKAGIKYKLTPQIPKPKGKK
ncbi:hypothetical protein IR012_14860 [Pseudomonas putida]|uniref:hypothetical protein n=1 Tax=Pseudomonas putida TaxID=303 RepID=UPI000FBA5C92|nr:hypothetical protein [Pseudomonas putida]MBF8670790.1 hypothetical protein [Pseudomonas putida]MBF8713582.1 hypothetical protein [Pseudomonas putida]